MVLDVPDTRQALRQYASHILRRWKPRVIAVAGSAGKTTAKEAIAEVARLRSPTFRSWRNYNDLLGIPLSLGRLTPEHRVAVLEFGSDHPGEIRELCEMTRPEIGVVLNVSPAHLQYFGDIRTLRDELFELARALPVDGVAILNGLDLATRAWLKIFRQRRCLFGLAESRGSSGDDRGALPLAARHGRPALSHPPASRRRRASRRSNQLLTSFWRAVGG